MASATVAFAVATIFMFALRPFALSIGLVDAPNGRKSHVGNVPVIGGIAMFVGMFAGFIILPIPGIVLLNMFIASFILVVIGIIDDRFGLSAATRLASHVVAVILMFFGAKLSLLDIGDPFGTGLVTLGRVTLIFTTLVFVTMINAYNFVDGADGLAGSLTLIGLLAVSVVSGLSSVWGVAALSVSAAIVGFLLFNFPSDFNRSFRSFMGDTGSTLLGFTMAWVTLGVCQGPDRAISPVFCLWFAAIPIFDLLTCFIRRLMRERSPLAPGKDHFHHILERGNRKVRRALSILTGLQLVYAVVALVCHSFAVPDVVMFVAWSILGLTQRWTIWQIAKYGRLSRIRELRRTRQQAQRQA